MYGLLFIMEHLKILSHTTKKLAEQDEMVCRLCVIYFIMKLILCSIGESYLQTLLMIHTVHIKKKWQRLLNSIWRLDYVDDNYYYPILRTLLHLQLMIIMWKKTAVIIVHIISTAFLDSNLTSITFYIKLSIF